MTTIEQVAQFNRVFGVQYEQRRGISVALIQEELNELRAAIANNDRVLILDALTDLQYVLDGAFLAFGLAPVKDAAFAEVHRSNMSKLAADGTAIRRHDGKVMKGPNYTPPNLSQFI